jgi:hypothetical protein
MKEKESGGTRSEVLQEGFARSRKRAEVQVKHRRTQVGRQRHLSISTATAVGVVVRAAVTSQPRSRRI